VRRTASLLLLSLFALAVVAAVTIFTSAAHADDDATSLSPFSLSAPGILGPPPSSYGLRLDSTLLRVTGFDQFGHGYQAQGGPTPLSPGSERATIFEPELEVVFTQGDRLTHRLFVPVDVVTNASPNSISVDVVTTASRHVEGGTLDWATDYRASRTTSITFDNAIRLEEPFRSFHSGVAARRSFADEATVVSASAISVYDWFDHFDIHGNRTGHTDRSGTTGSVGFTQVLTPTTLATINYGLTLMTGTLGNTWNSVPLSTGDRGPEILPSYRTRHALVGRAAQWLPWNGALRLYYRFYADSWGIVAHSLEGQLMQRLSPELYVGAYYRYHTQTGAYFFTTLAPDDGSLRVADSDLAPLDSQTVGGKVVLDLPLVGDIRAVHFELAAERYVRTNDLQMNIVSWATGFRF
jgi:hypothetical protein